MSDHRTQTRLVGVELGEGSIVGIRHRVKEVGMVMDPAYNADDQTLETTLKVQSDQPVPQHQQK